MQISTTVAVAEAVLMLYCEPINCTMTIVLADKESQQNNGPTKVFFAFWLAKPWGQFKILWNMRYTALSLTL